MFNLKPKDTKEQTKKEQTKMLQTVDDKKTVSSEDILGALSSQDLTVSVEPNDTQTAEDKKTVLSSDSILDALGSQDLTQRTVNIEPNKEHENTIEIKPVSDISPVKESNLAQVQNIINEVQTDYAPERQVEQYEALLNKRTSLKDRLARHQFSKEQAEKTLNELMKEAQQVFGTTDLNEIAQIVLEQAKQNQTNLSQFEQELNQIEKQLTQFEAELAQLGE